MTEKKRIRVNGLNDFIRELRRFYARGKGADLETFVAMISDIAEKTLGFPCYFDLELGRGVIREEELIEDTLFVQEREDVLVCEDDKLKLKLKLHHRILVVDIEYSNWIGVAPVKILDLNLLEVVRG